VYNLLFATDILSVCNIFVCEKTKRRFIASPTESRLWHATGTTELEGFWVKRTEVTPLSTKIRGKKKRSNNRFNHAKASNHHSKDDE